MDEIGSLLKSTREDSGISISEAGEDLGIKDLILENIEDGNIGCFKDIFVLKENIYDYAKYLGLDPEEITNEFNEYLFEYTSKIPLKEIEKAVREQAKEDTHNEKVASPYTAPQKKSRKIPYIALYVALGLILVLVIIWSVRQITINNQVAKEISLIK